MIAANSRISIGSAATNNNKPKAKAQKDVIVGALLITTLTALLMIPFYHQVQAQTVIATVAVGDFPVGVGVNPTTNRAYVSNNFDDTVSVIDGTTNTVIATVAVGDAPRGVGVNPTTDRVYVANIADDTVSVIDGTTNTVIATVAVGDFPVGVGVNPTTNRAYVSNNFDDTVSVIDGTTNTVIATVAVGDAPRGVGVNPTTDRVYVANIGDDTVSVIDGTTNTVIATVAVGDAPRGVGVNPTTDRVYVANIADDTVSVIDDSPIIIGPQSTLALEPKTDANKVDSEHCVTATVKDESGNPVPDVTVEFDVTGSNSESGSDITNEDGEAEFCYTGQLLGEDAITAFADTDEDGDQDAEEPFDAATKTWTAIPSTPGCEVFITGGGRITAANGDKATFGGNAKVSELGAASGQQQYRDHGPEDPMRVKSKTVSSVPCVIDDGGDDGEASIFGTATIDGSGSFAYRIDVDDNGEPGKGIDTYHILLSNDYDSGVQTLKAGNIQVQMHTDDG
jgi:YVTN family beta-propeller protein